MPEQSKPSAVRDDVFAVLRALTPTDALTEALRPMSRSPGHLSYSWAVVGEEELSALAGFPPPRLPVSAGDGLCEVFAVHGRDGVARPERDGSGRLVVTSFAGLLPSGVLDVAWCDEVLGAEQQHHGCSRP